MTAVERGVRLADLAGVLSLVSDLAMGQPLEHALRQRLIAMRLGRRVGLSNDDLEIVAYAGLLAWVGCHVDAHEQAKWFVDDLRVKAEVRHTDLRSARTDFGFLVPRIGGDQPVLTRIQTGLRFVAGGGADEADAMLSNHCQAVQVLADGLSLPAAVASCIEQTFERWDGRGAPHGVAGDQIALTSRIVNLADVVEVYHRAGGVAAAVAVARARRGTQFDPALVDVFCAAADELLAGLEQAAQEWVALGDPPPQSTDMLTGRRLDIALEAIADFVDVKSPYTFGHSRGVADLAGAAAQGLGLPTTDVVAVRHAGLLHDLGRMGVPNAVWDKRGRLTLTETERVRLHPYWTERALRAAAPLAPLATIAGQHHERLDGSGYPRGIGGADLTPAARVLAAADEYHAMVEPRPHREAATPAEAASSVLRAVRAGRLDGDAVDAVLKAAGHRIGRRPANPYGLTPREIEVLRLLARGQPTKQIASSCGSRARPRATTSSTSTPSWACPTAPWRASSPRGTACSTLTSRIRRTATRSPRPHRRSRARPAAPSS